MPPASCVSFSPLQLVFGDLMAAGALPHLPLLLLVHFACATAFVASAIAACAADYVLVVVLALAFAADVAASNANFLPLHVMLVTHCQILPTACRISSDHH